MHDRARRQSQMRALAVSYLARVDKMGSQAVEDLIQSCFFGELVWVM